MLNQWTIGIGIGYDRDNQPIDICRRGVILQEIADYLVQQFDGYTEVCTRGAWRDYNGIVVTEEGRSYHVITDAKHADMVATADFVGDIANQASVVLVHPDGSAEFINVGCN